MFISPAVVSSPKALVIAIPVGTTSESEKAVSFPKVEVRAWPVTDTSISVKAVSFPSHDRLG